MSGRLKDFLLYIQHIRKNGLRNTDYNVLIFILYGVIFDALNNMVRPFSVKFVQRLGGSDFDISLMSSLPGLIAIFAVLPGAILIGRVVNKKRITAVFFAISRTFILSLTIIPFLPAQIQAIVFVLVFSLMNLPDSISQTSLQGYLGDIFPANRRAMSLALRNKYGNISVLVVIFISGLILNFAVHSNAGKIRAYQIFLIIAFIMAIFEIFVFLKFKEPKQTAVQTEKIQIKSVLAGIFKDKKFRAFQLTTIVFYFAWYMGWPLGNIIFINNIQANELWVAINTIASVLIIALTSTFWGKKVQKHSNAPVLSFCAVGMGLTIAATPWAFNALSYVIITAVVAFFLSGLNIALFNGLLEATPDKNRVIYIGVFNTVTSVALAAAPFVSIFISDRIGYKALGAIIGCMRFLGAGVVFAGYLYKKRKNS